MAGCCMGSGSFIYAAYFSQYGLVGLGILAPGPLVAWIVIKLISVVVY